MQKLRKVSNSKKGPLVFSVYCQQMFYLLGSTPSPNSAHFHPGPCQWASEGSQCPCEFDARISMFPQTEQHSRGDTLGCLTYFTVVSLKELQEAGLSASGAFYTPKAQVIPSPLQVLQVHA